MDYVGSMHSDGGDVLLGIETSYGLCTHGNSDDPADEYDASIIVDYGRGSDDHDDKGLGE